MIWTGYIKNRISWTCTNCCIKILPRLFYSFLTSGTPYHWTSVDFLVSYLLFTIRVGGSHNTGEWQPGYVHRQDAANTHSIRSIIPSVGGTWEQGLAGQHWASTCVLPRNGTWKYAWCWRDGSRDTYPHACLEYRVRPCVTF